MFDKTTNIKAKIADVGLVCIRITNGVSQKERRWPAGVVIIRRYHSSKNKLEARYFKLSALAFLNENQTDGIISSQLNGRAGPGRGALKYQNSILRSEAINRPRFPAICIHSESLWHPISKSIYQRVKIIKALSLSFLCRLVRDLWPKWNWPRRRQGIGNWQCKKGANIFS